MNFGRPWPKYDPDRAESELVDALNEARAKASKPPLRTNAKLASAARHHARGMAERDAPGPKDDENLGPVEPCKTTATASGPSPSRWPGDRPPRGPP